MENKEAVVESEALKKKHEAEAVKFIAEGEALLIEARSIADKNAAEGRKFAAEASKLEAEASNAQVYAREKLRDERKELSAGKHHFVYHFTSEVSDSSVKACIDQLDVWRRGDNEKKEIEIIFSSPGGSIIDGFVLYDYIQMVKKNGWKINTGTLGMAASMAGILLQAGDVRWMSGEAWVLIHQASFGTQGKMGQVEDTVAWVKRMQERILDIFSQRAAKATNGNAKWIRNKMTKLWARRDWWLSSDECKKWGFVDEVR